MPISLLLSDITTFTTIRYFFFGVVSDLLFNMLRLKEDGVYQGGYFQKLFAEGAAFKRGPRLSEGGVH